MKKIVILAILDGWGIGASDDTNPIFMSQPPNINYIKSHYPAGALTASGVAVGLPWGEEGNSEVGHSIIGTGKVIYQHYPRITLSIREGKFYQNESLKKAFDHAKENNSYVNMVGLLSDGNVHSSLEHLDSLLKFAEMEGIKNIKLHLFADGRDSAPKTILGLLNKVPKKLIRSIGGRFYGMDRDRHWDRTERAYNVLTGQGTPVPNFEEEIKKFLEENPSEEYLPPMLTGNENGGIKDNESVIFFNYREDRGRQLVSAFVTKDFGNFTLAPLKNVYMVSMTMYSDKFNMPVAFPAEIAENPLGKILSDAGKMQVRLAETEKYAHITYFFNGYRDTPFKNEYRILVPSRNIEHHDEHPEMMATEITSRAINLMNEGVFDFILINYANPDIIAHTGNFDAAMRAIKCIDENLGELTNAALAVNAALIITSDHGNVERMRNPATGTVKI